MTVREIIEMLEELANNGYENATVTNAEGDNIFSIVDNAYEENNVVIYF